MLLIHQQVLQIYDLVGPLIFDFRRKSFKHLPVVFWGSQNLSLLTSYACIVYFMMKVLHISCFYSLSSLPIKSLSFQDVSAILRVRIIYSPNVVFSN